MNWHQRIMAARKRRGFTSEDRKLAMDWVTCACGEQDPRIQREEGGEPTDDELWILGGEFAEAVIYGKYDDASRLLAKIEIRATEILAEVTA